VDKILFLWSSSPDTRTKGMWIGNLLPFKRSSTPSMEWNKAGCYEAPCLVPGSSVLLSWYVSYNFSQK